MKKKVIKLTSKSLINLNNKKRSSQIKIDNWKESADNFNMKRNLWNQSWEALKASFREKKEDTQANNWLIKNKLQGWMGKYLS